MYMHLIEYFKCLRQVCKIRNNNTFGLSLSAFNPFWYQNTYKNKKIDKSR